MIKITKMKVGDYPVEVPVGLSELLVGCWVKNKKVPAFVHEYESIVEKREDGQLFTKLIKKNRT